MGTESIGVLVVVDSSPDGFNTTDGYRLNVGLDRFEELRAKFNAQGERLAESRTMNAEDWGKFSALLQAEGVAFEKLGQIRTPGDFSGQEVQDAYVAAHEAMLRGERPA